MGKRKIHNFKIIDNVNGRNVTYCKRKKGLIKKAMQLSFLCGQDIYLSIFDQEKQKLVVYQSSDKYDAKTVWRAENSDLKLQQYFEKYTNDNKNEIDNDKIKVVRCYKPNSRLKTFQIEDDPSEQILMSESDECFLENPIL